MKLQIFGGFYPFNPSLGQKIQTVVPGENVDAAYIAHFQVAAADAKGADADGIHAAVDCSADTTVVVDDEFAQPVVPVNITATTAAEAADVGNIAAVQVKVYGTNYLGEAISEQLPAFTADEASTKAGSKAFKTVTKVEIPAMSGSGVSVTIGFGEKLGLPYKLTHGLLLGAFSNNILEENAPVITTSATNIESNTIDLASELDGEKAVDVYLVV